MNEKFLSPETVSDHFPACPRKKGTSSRAVFHCTADPGCEKQCWDAFVEIIRCTPDLCEAVAEGRSTTFHFVVGHHRDGNFLCVPSHDFGCDLSRLSDTFWNREHIRVHLCPVDCVTLVNAIACLDSLWSGSHSRSQTF